VIIFGLVVLYADEMFFCFRAGQVINVGCLYKSKYGPAHPPFASAVVDAQAYPYMDALLIASSPYIRRLCGTYLFRAMLKIRALLAHTPISLVYKSSSLVIGKQRQCQRRKGRKLTVLWPR